MKFMKKSVFKGLVLAIISVIMASCVAEQQRNNYFISGTTPEDDSSRVVYMQVYKDTTILDSAIVENHKFTFEGYVDKAVMVAVNNGDIHNGWLFFLEDDTLTLVDTLYYALGGKLNKEYQNFEEESSYLPDDENTDEYRQLMLKYWSRHNNDALGGYVLSLAYYGMNVKAMDSLVATGGESIQSDVLFNMVKKNIALQKKTSEGQKFSDATLKDLDGNIHKLSEYVGKGKYVIMDCWASWCPPCRRLIPELKQIYAQYKGKGVEVVGIATRDELEDTRKAVEELQIPWTVLTDNDANKTIRDVYGFEGIPFVIMFAPDGTIIKRNIDEKIITEILYDKVK